MIARSTPHMDTPRTEQRDPQVVKAHARLARLGTGNELIIDGCKDCAHPAASAISRRISASSVCGWVRDGVQCIPSRHARLPHLELSYLSSRDRAAIDQEAHFTRDERTLDAVQVRINMTSDGCVSCHLKIRRSRLVTRGSERLPRS
jgi:hypothetical protein